MGQRETIEGVGLKGDSTARDTSTLSACTYVCAVYEEVARDPEGCDLLTLLVLVGEEAVLPFLRLLHVCLNLQQSAQHSQHDTQHDAVSTILSARCCQNDAVSTTSSVSA